MGKVRLGLYACSLLFLNMTFPRGQCNTAFATYLLQSKDNVNVTQNDPKPQMSHIQWHSESKSLIKQNTRKHSSESGNSYFDFHHPRLDRFFSIAVSWHDLALVLVFFLFCHFNTAASFPFVAFLIPTVY